MHGLVGLLSVVFACVDLSGTRKLRHEKPWIRPGNPNQTGSPLLPFFLQFFGAGSIVRSVVSSTGFQVELTRVVGAALHGVGFGLARLLDHFQVIALL